MHHHFDDVLTIEHFMDFFIPDYVDFLTFVVIAFRAGTIVGHAEAQP